MRMLSLSMATGLPPLFPMLAEGDRGGVPLADDEPDVYRLLRPLPPCRDCLSTEECSRLKELFPVAVSLLRKLEADGVDECAVLVPSADWAGARTDPR